MAALQQEAEAVTDAFKNIANTTLDDELREKCVNLCRAIGLDGEALATQWESFALNHNYDVPTAKHLDKLGEHLQRKARNSSQTSTPTTTPGVKQRFLQSTGRKSNGTTSKSRTPGSTARVTPVKGSGVFQEAFGVNIAAKLPPTTPPQHRGTPGSSISKASSGSRRIRAAAPDSARSAKVARTSVASQLSPSTSPLAGLTPSQKYAKRTNMGKVDNSFNKHLPHATAAQIPLSNLEEQDELALGRPDRCVVKRVDPLKESTDPSKNKMLYMYTTLEEKGFQLNVQLENARSEFAQRLGVSDFDRIGETSQAPVLVCGRICCESEGKLNAKSVVLEGSLEDHGRRVAVDTSELQSYSFFPGQLVAIRGMCSQSDVLVAKEVYSDLRVPRAKTSLSKLKEYAEQMDKAKPPTVRTPPPLSVVVASGPYTLHDNLDFEPFEDLLAVLAEDGPDRVPADVLVLMGPFVDVNHPAIVSGNPIREFEENGETIPISLTIEEVYEIFFDRVGKAIEQLSSLSKVILVPSLDDAIHRPSFPQPAFKKAWFRDFQHPEKVLLLKNPGTFTVNEVVVGVTTQDIVMNLSSEDTTFSGKNVPKEDRMTRLVSHMINQHSYYPLFPPAPDAFVDITLGEHYQLPVTPDVMLCFSKLNPFVRNVNDVLAINPGKLCKGAMGGVFARLSIHPLKTPNNSLAVSSQSSQESTGSTTTDQEDVLHQVVTRTRVDLVRI